MADKIKIAINWAAACGGCDVSLLDTEAKIFDLVAIADIVYWPVALDFKRDDLKSFKENEIDIGIFNGAIRTSEHAEDAKLLREKCKVIIAYGACASFGGIPGLGNLHSKDSIFERVYKETPSTVNEKGTYPQIKTEMNGFSLELPEFEATVRALQHIVDIDYIMPGCPPTPERILDAINVIANYAENKTLPPKGAVIASEKTLCDECDRIKTRTGKRISEIKRPHEIIADSEKCFMEQGILCSGITTRGGCGGKCINVNMPCRGCFGPTAEMKDPGAEALSTIGSITALDYEDEIPAHERISPIRSIKDISGTFYRFTFPTAVVFRALNDVPDK